MQIAGLRSPPLSWLQPAVLTGSLIPFFLLVWRAATGRLGANPIATAENQLGLLALIFLLASLTCTPLKILFSFKWPLRIRKTLGLLSFFSVLSHFLVYAVLDQYLIFRAIFQDVAKRPFIAIGFIGFLLLIPLAVTSTKGALQRLGARRWRRLHSLAYVVAILAVIHFTMRVKADVSEPVLYASYLALLFAVRILDRLKRATARKRSA